MSIRALDGGTGHCAAFLGTPLAGIGTLLAVIRLVLAALRSAGVADFGADSAHLMGELRAATHVGRRPPARLGTVPVESDALGHFRYVALAHMSMRSRTPSRGNTDPIRPCWSRWLSPSS